MTGVEGIAAIAQADGALVAPAPTPAQGAPGTFARMLLEGVSQVDQKLAHADAMSMAFALDPSIPPHQVTIALEEAKLSLELMLQVRTHLVDGYNELLRMQL